MANVMGGGAADMLSGTAERDYIAAGGGNDTIDSGAGNDWVEGGTGADTFVFNPGCGWDCVGDFKIAEGDRIDLRGWSAIRSTANLTIQADGNDTVILFGPNDGVRLMGVAASSLTAAQFLFAGGTTGGTTGDPTTPSTPSSTPPATGGRTLTGTATRDNLIGGAGNDTITAGGGYDYLEGGAGSDTFVCAAGDSWDYIQDFQAGNGGDVLDLRAWGNIRSLADVTISSDASGTSLVFGPNDGMRLNSVLASALTAANFRFAEQGSGGTPTPPPTPGGQTLTGTAGRDNLVGGAGNDTIAAGAGADYIEGRGGSDTIVARSGNGWDYVQDFQAGTGGDVIDLTGVAGIHGMGDLTFSSDATGTSVVYGTSDGLRLNGVAAGALTAANFRFAGAPGGSGLRIEGVSWVPGSVNASAVTQVNTRADGTVVGTSPVHTDTSMTPDGRYLVFTSRSDTGDSVVLKDLETGALRTLAAVDYSPEGRLTQYRGPAISANGRYAAYVESVSYGVGASRHPVETVVRVQDLETGATVGYGPGSSNVASRVRISDDGRYISFVSQYSTGNAEGMPSITHVDRQTGARTSFGGSEYAMSRDGRMVAALTRYDFWTDQRSLYIQDTQTGSRTYVGAFGYGDMRLLSFSADGRQLLVASDLANLAPGDRNGTTDLFLFDVRTGAATRVSTTATGGDTNGESASGTLTADGGTLIFTSSASNLVDGDTNGRTDIFSKDLATGEVRRLSTAADGAEVNGSASAVAVSADGGRVIYASTAEALGAGTSEAKPALIAVDPETLEANGQPGAAGAVNLTVGIAGSAGATTATIHWGDGRTSVQELGAGATELSAIHQYTANGRLAGTITLTGQGGETATAGFTVQAAPDPGMLRRVSTAADGTQVRYSALDPVISGDGRFVAFYSFDALDGSSGGAISVKNLQTGAVAMTRLLTNLQYPGDYALSRDGRYLAYSDQTVRDGDTNRSADIYVKDLQTGNEVRVTAAADGTPANQGGSAPSMSADGRYVAYSSNSSNLGAGDANNDSDIFVKDVQTGAIVCASTAADGTFRNGYSVKPQISADGRYVMFLSSAGKAGDRDGLYVKDLQTGSVTAVLSDKGAYSYALSGNGRYAAFVAQSGLLPGDTASGANVYVRDLQTGALSLASAAPDGTVANADSTDLAISEDGRHVTFASLATNLVPDRLDPGRHIYIKDMQSGAVTLVRSADGVAPEPFLNMEHLSLSISADGRTVAFASPDVGLVAGDTNGVSDVFVFDSRATGSTLAGGADWDVLLGNALGDTLSGGAGEDYLSGGYGGDLLDGNEGDDVLMGGAGNDTLTGGVGADVFVFAPDGGQDVITDFNPLGDHIQLTAGQDWTLGATLNGDALISFSATDSVTLIGVRPDQVTSGLFITS